MADFDAIYTEEVLEETIEEPRVFMPDPILIRGAGNMTVYVFLYIYSQPLGLELVLVFVFIT